MDAFAIASMMAPYGSSILGRHLAQYAPKCRWAELWNGFLLFFLISHTLVGAIGLALLPLEEGLHRFRSPLEHISALKAHDRIRVGEQVEDELWDKMQDFVVALVFMSTSGS